MKLLMSEGDEVAHHVRDQVILCSTLETVGQEFRVLFRYESVSGQKTSHAFSRKLRLFDGLGSQRAKRKRENEIADWLGFLTQGFAHIFIGHEFQIARAKNVGL